MRYARYCTVLMLAFSLGACGHGKAPEDQADAAAPNAQSATPPQPAAQAPAPDTAPDTDATRPLQVSDLDAYVKGMQKEIELRQAASDKAAKAKAGNDQATEISGLAELTSVEVTNAGARAAGVDRARYDFITHAIDRVLSTLEMNAMMAKLGDAAQTQKFQSDPYAGLAPEVVAALKARHDELAKLRTQNMTILANARNL